jgi:hypothetical protein
LTQAPEKPGDPGGPFDVAALTSERRDELLGDLARKVVRRRLQTPAIFFLEMNKPLTSLASTAITFSQPTLGAFFGFQRMAEWAALLSDRENVERLIQRIEGLADEGTENAMAQDPTDRSDPTDPSDSRHLAPGPPRAGPPNEETT